MCQTAVMLTVLFEEPYWVGLCERRAENQYEVCKITFGAEPKDYEVKDFLNRNWERFRFSPALSDRGADTDRKINPKRIQRQINKQLQNTEIGTKAQQALSMQREACKLERKTKSREQRLEEKERQFQIRQEKKKQKHRGH